MFLPLALILTATLSAAIVAYGTHPGWAQYGGGLEFILFSRRFEWPLFALAVIGCIVLLGLIVSGKRRSWWLIGLGPVLALFVHHLRTDPTGQFLVLEGPAFVTADEASKFLKDDDYVVGLQFEGTSYAYPYADLFWTPCVIQVDHDKRMILMWSAGANRSVASLVQRDVHARELEIVSTPADSVLIYDRRLGQFINGVTGQTPSHTKPVGFSSALPTERMTWKQWHQKHQETRVMSAATSGKPRGPSRPVQPGQKMPKAIAADPHLRDPIVLVGSRDPIAMLVGDITAEPVNTRADGTGVMVFRDPTSGEIRAFDRKVVDDLVPTFRVNTDARRKGAAYVDTDTASGWDTKGLAVTGKTEFKGKQLARIPVDDQLYWGVMKYWYPDLKWAEVITPAPMPKTNATGDEPVTKPVKPRRRSRQ